MPAAGVISSTKNTNRRRFPPSSVRTAPCSLSIRLYDARWNFYFTFSSSNTGVCLLPPYFCYRDCALEVSDVLVVRYLPRFLFHFCPTFPRFWDFCNPAFNLPLCFFPFFFSLLVMVGSVSCRKLSFGSNESFLPKHGGVAFSNSPLIFFTSFLFPSPLNPFFVVFFFVVCLFFFWGWGWLFLMVGGGCVLAVAVSCECGQPPDWYLMSLIFDDVWLCGGSLSTRAGAEFPSYPDLNRSQSRIIGVQIILPVVGWKVMFRDSCTFFLSKVGGGLRVDAPFLHDFGRVSFALHSYVLFLSPRCKIRIWWGLGRWR